MVLRKDDEAETDPKLYHCCCKSIKAKTGVLAFWCLKVAEVIATVVFINKLDEPFNFTTGTSMVYGLLLSFAMGMALHREQAAWAKVYLIIAPFCYFVQTVLYIWKVITVPDMYDQYDLNDPTSVHVTRATRKFMGEMLTLMVLLAVWEYYTVWLYYKFLKDEKYVLAENGMSLSRLDAVHVEPLPLVKGREPPSRSQTKLESTGRL
ncbi:unnamed protein product, partial [Mesorhabditis spiculigera]